MDKSNDLQEGLLKFEGQYYDLQLNTLNQFHVWLHPIESYNRLTIAIDIGEDTTREQIRGAIPNALNLRDKLMEFQGPWMAGGDNLYLESLSHKQTHGRSYKKLANDINKKIERHLVEYIKYREEIDSLYPQHKKDFESEFYFYIYSYNFVNNCFGLINARDMLKALVFKDEEIIGILKDGLDLARTGEPFPDEYPVYQRKMIDKLRTWRIGKEHKALTVVRGKIRENPPNSNK